jgi:hypothetical protein
MLPTQRQWLANALRNGRQVVVEPWLERQLDFSVQLEMGPRNLTLCGYTGLLNDRKGQFLGNWAETDYHQCLPAKVAGLFRSLPEISERLQRLYTEIFSLLEAELRRVGFVGPVSIDAFVYRTPEGDTGLKPIVEINPRYTMGRLTVELMKHTSPGTSGVFRLINHAQAKAEGFPNLAAYAQALTKRHPLRLEPEPVGSAGVPACELTGRPARCPSLKIGQGALCLNDPDQAQVCLATFEVNRTLDLPDSPHVP